MKLPTELRINGRVVRLRPRPASTMQEAYGTWNEGRTRIDYRTRMSPELQRDTILHEVMHALRSLQGRENGGDVEEDYVRSLATGLIGVFDDNPEFAQWLVAKKKG